MLCYVMLCYVILQGGSNMTGTDVARFTHKQSRSFLNHLVYYILSLHYVMEYTICNMVADQQTKNF